MDVGLRAAAILGVLLMALMAPAVAGPSRPSPQARGPFEVVRLEAIGRRVDTLFYDFTGDGIGDALTVSIDFDPDPPARWLALHVGARPGALPEKPTQAWPAAEFAAAVVVANVLPEGGVDIGLLAPDGLFVHAFENGAMPLEPRKLLHVKTFFSDPSPSSLPIWHAQMDLSEDGLDDLVLPVPDGYRIYFQTERGRFGRVARLEAERGPETFVTPRRFAIDWERGLGRGLPPTASLFDLYEQLPRLDPVDLDGDGLKELVTVRGNTLAIYAQPRAREIDPRPRFYRIRTLEEERRKDTVSLSAVRFLDLDADGNMDLVVTRIEGELQLFESVRTRIYTHIGNGRGSFQADKSINIDGVCLNPEFIDMNGDGRLDCLTSRLRTDLVAKGLEASVLGDVTITYEVFQFDARINGYRPDPVFQKDVHVRTEDIRKRGAASRPLYFVPGDLSGDGRPDAVFYNPTTSAVEVYRGRDVWAPGGSEKRIDFEKHRAAEQPIPDDPKWFTFMDLDGDNRTDVLLHYAGGVTILLSRFR